MLIISDNINFKSISKQHSLVCMKSYKSNIFHKVDKRKYNINPQ